jgi:hypothetical protein
MDRQFASASDDMPFKSQAQRRKFAELLVKGKISNETYEEWTRETGNAKLPERIKPRVKKKSTSKTASSKRSGQPGAATKSRRKAK